MKNNRFHLNDRSVLLVSPLTTIATNLIFQLTEMGANVALVNPDARESSERFAEEISNLKEVDRDRGRLFAVSHKTDDPTCAKEIIGLSAELLGGIDSYIDADILGGSRTAAAISSSLLEPFKTRRKGRIIFLLPEIYPETGGPEDTPNHKPILLAAERRSLEFVAQSLTPEARRSDSTMNCLVVGLTEEFLLDTFPNCGINEATKKFQEKHPEARAADTQRIAELVGFLASPLGLGISGQTLSSI